jgi:hypothetical protein
MATVSVSLASWTVELCTYSLRHTSVTADALLDEHVRNLSGLPPKAAMTMSTSSMFRRAG